MNWSPQSVVEVTIPEVTHMPNPDHIGSLCDTGGRVWKLSDEPVNCPDCLSYMSYG